MPPTLTEMAILKALWQLEAASARELHDASVHETQWSYSSTRKTINRMVTKGLLVMDTFHGIQIYRAGMPKLTTIATVIQHFASGFLGVEKGVSAAAFAQSDLLTPDEIDDLQALLDSLTDAEDGEPS